MKLLFENWRQYLKEEQLLIEGRIEDVKKKYPDLDERGLLDILIDKDPSGNQKYLAWAAKQLAQREDATSQTADYAAANIDLYHKLRAHIPAEYRDINSIKDLRDLERIASSAYQKKAEKDRLKAIEAKYKKEAMENSDVIWKDEDFLMVRPFNSGASCFWGRGTRWCISATESQNYFNQYSGEGKAFYFLFMKNKNNFSTTEYRKFHKLALVYDGSTQEFEEAYDAADDSMADYEVINVIASNLFGERFPEAYSEAEDYGFELEGQFEEDYPEYYETIVSVLRKEGYELDDLEQFWEERVSEVWNEINGYASGHFMDNPAGPSEADYDKIYEEADLQNVYVSYEEYEPGQWYYSGGLSFDFDQDKYEFGPPADPLELDDFDIEDEVREVLDDHGVYPREIEIYGNDIRIDIDADDDYYTSDPVQRFANFVDTMSEIDEKYEEIKQSLLNMFIDQGVLDISDEPVGKLKAKLAEKDLKNFDLTYEGRTIESNSNIFEYPKAGINAAVMDIMDVMGYTEMAKAGSPDNIVASNKIVEYVDKLKRQIVYFFRQSFESEEGRSHADNVLFDKMDTLLDQAYRDAEKQLTIPGLEQPERKRLVPPLAVGFTPGVYVSSMEDEIKLRLRIKADAELGEEQAGYIAEFIDFFDENFDALGRIVGEVVDKLLKEAVVKTLEKAKEEMPDRARALGIDESKKKRGIRILLGNRR